MVLKGPELLHRKYPELEKQVNKVANAGHRLFTFMKYSYVDSTNNLAERLLREIVKHRAIRTVFRTEGGAETFGTLMSIFMTYKYADTELMPLLKKHL